MKRGVITNAADWRSKKLQGSLTMQGLPISIENDRGSYRQGTDEQGNMWRSFMHIPYGYVKGTEGVDGDHVDVYVGPDHHCSKVFIVHQNNPYTGKYDEDKCMLGFHNGVEAKAAYLRQYDRPDYFGSMLEVDMATFKAMLKENKGLKLKKSMDDKHGFLVDMESATVENDNFRKVLFTGPHAQLVLMSLKPGENIGMEVHKTLDQFIRADGGSGIASIGGKAYKLTDGSAIIVPAGAKHDIRAGKDGLKLYAVYTETNHPDDVIDETKADAEEREGSEDLEKAKYIKRWRDQNGRYQYMYPGDAKSHNAGKRKFLPIVQDLPVMADRRDVARTLPQRSSTSTKKKGTETVETFSDGFTKKTYDVTGVIYRGVTVEDYERILKQGHVDTDMRGAISENEGMNLTDDPRTALEYVPTGQAGVVLAFNAEDIDTWGIGPDDYIRTSDKIPLSKIIGVSAIFDKQLEAKRGEKFGLMFRLKNAMEAQEEAKQKGDIEAVEMWTKHIKTMSDGADDPSMVPWALKTARKELGLEKAKYISKKRGPDGKWQYTYYRGTTPGDKRRIKTGDNVWDSYLFVTDTPDGARLYGSQVDEVSLKPDAKILVEGSNVFKQLSAGTGNENMLVASRIVAERAQKLGYDAVHFKRQTDIGTVILNRDAVKLPLEKAKYIRKYRNKNGKWEYVYQAGAVRRAKKQPELKKLKNLGGSTGGAFLVETPSGQKRVMKQSTGPDHLKDEYTANRIYKILGVPVPKVDLHSMEDRPAQLADFIEGTPLNQLYGADRERAENSLREHFVADALLGNWDVLGMVQDNIIFDGTTSWRIDNGGALRYRAQGTPKGDMFGAEVTETASLRDPQRSASSVFGSVTDEDITRQAQAIIEKKSKILQAIDDPGLRKKMESRINSLGANMSKAVVKKASELRKAGPTLYIKKWWKNGRWNYEYAKPKGKGKKPGKVMMEHTMPGDQATLIPASQFAASDYGRGTDDPNVTIESIMAQTTPEVRTKLKETEEKLRNVVPTADKHRLSGEGDKAVYDEERSRMHEDIIREILSPENIVKAQPKTGKKPVLVMLGGRGGSGKSWFEGKVYDPNKAIVIDSDEIKGKLAEYQGWNAFEVHEESSDILEKIVTMSKAYGLNIVIDATLKTTRSAMARVDKFKEGGYEIECHYMHCPRQISAQRAVKRFGGTSGRYVPIAVVLSNTSNEETFDQVRRHAKAWNFFDSSGGPPPKLVSKKGKGRYQMVAKALSDATYPDTTDAWKYDFYDFRTPMSDPGDYTDELRYLIDKYRPGADLSKGKFLKRWRGRNGKWQYSYSAVEIKGRKVTIETKHPGKGGTVIGHEYDTIRPTLFAEARDNMTPKGFEAFVTKYTAEEYKAKGAKTYLSDSGLSGFAITNDGDLISVFSATGAHEGGDAIRSAIKMGAKTLDCLGPTLPTIYEKFGFKTTEVMDWDDQYAPPGWNYEEHGRPSVYMMKYEGGGRLKKSEDEKNTPAFEKLSKEYVQHLFGDEANGVLEKAKKKKKKKVKPKGDLNPVTRQVTRNGKTFNTLVWVKPTEAKKLKDKKKGT